RDTIHCCHLRGSKHPLPDRGDRQDSLEGNRRFSTQEMNSPSPNHALQRTAPCVTAPASTAAFPPTMQVPRRTPRSLSLGSLGVATRVVFSAAIFRVLANLMSATLYPVVALPSRTPSPARHHLSPLAVHS